MTDSPYFEISPSAAADWHILDYRSDVLVSAPAGADGVCTVTFDPVDSGQLWEITRATVACTSATATEARFYLDDVSDARLLSGSSSGNFDEADYPGDGLWIEESRQLLVRWTGCAAGAVATCRIQYRKLTRRVG